LSSIPAEHLKYLQRRPFHFNCHTEVFPADELRALEESGNWLEALVNGVIQPVTPDQEHFLQVDRGEAEPETVWERAWLRLKGRREYEAEQEMKPPPRKQDNYGITDWDHDRCWW